MLWFKNSPPPTLAPPPRSALPSILRDASGELVARGMYCLPLTLRASADEIERLTRKVQRLKRKLRKAKGGAS